MRIKMILEAKRPLTIPWSYRTALTSGVYNLLRSVDADYGAWLHESGYQRGKRKYRLFVYSNLRPMHFVASREGMKADGSFIWEVSTPDRRFADKFLAGLKSRGRVSVFENELELLDLMICDPPSLPAGATWRTLSPILVSTWDGKSAQPTYRNPSEPEFASALENNLIAKWEAFHGKEWTGERLGVRMWNPKSTLVPVFTTNVRAWYLKLQMWGSEELIRFAYDAGLGEKNSQGFGMIEIGG